MPIKRNVIITQQSLDANGFSAPVDLDPAIAPFNVAIQVFVPAGSSIANGGYRVEFTLDDLMLPDGRPRVLPADVAAVRWTTDPQFPDGSTGTITGNYFAPISAVRVHSAAITGQIELKIRQGDSIN
jgi:hypothetical protein